MPRLLVFILVFYAEYARAQYSPRIYYSVDAPCDSIQALHIKKITITKEYCKDTVTDRYGNITTETYDRKGNLLTQDHRNPGNGYTGKQYIYHHFTYDTAGRLISDSTTYDDQLHLTTYEYIPDWVITHRTPDYSDSSVIVYTSYVGDRIHTSFGIDAKGDTMYVYVSWKDRIDESRWRKEGSKKVLQEHNEMYVAGGDTTWLRSCTNCDQYNYQIEKIYTDSNARVSRRTFMTTGFIITDDYYYSFNENGSLARCIWISKDDSITSCQTDIFIYNERHQLTEKKTTFTSSSLVIQTYYTYYPNGLLMQKTEDSGNGYPQCVKWEYEYW